MIGLAAFIVPFMFFQSDAMLLKGSWFDSLHVTATAIVGVYLLSAAVQGWFFGKANKIVRIVLLIGGLTMINAGWLTDAIGLTIFAVLFAFQKRFVTARDMVKGGD